MMRTLAMHRSQRSQRGFGLVDAESLGGHFWLRRKNAAAFRGRVSNRVAWMALIYKKAFLNRRGASV